MRKLMILGVLIGTMAVSACNTARGAKEDVHSAADAVGNATDGKK